MSLYTPAFLAASQRQGFMPHRVVEITFPSGVKRMCEEAADFSAAGLHYEDVLLPKGWSAVPRGITPRGASMNQLEVYCTAGDTNGSITKLIEGGQQPRGSPFKWFGAIPPPAAVTDWQPLFSGVLDRWEKQDKNWKLIGRPNVFAFQTLMPRQQILASEYPLGLATSRGAYMSQVYGTIDSSSTSGTGGISCPNLAFDAGSSSWWYLVTQGRALSVDRVYYDKVLKTVTTDYTVDYPIIRGKQITRIKSVAAPAGGTAAVVTADVHGLETVGDGTGVLIASPVDQVRHWLINFLFNNYQSGLWLTDISAPIDSASWNLISSYANLRGWEGSHYEGGKTTQRTAETIVNEWLSSWPILKLFWKQNGNVGIMALRLEDPGYPPGEIVLLRADDVAAGFKITTDTQQITNDIAVKYCYTPVDGKAWGTVEMQALAQAALVSAPSIPLNMVQGVGHL